MSVVLKKKAVRSKPVSHPKSMGDALLAVLMYFPHQKCRALASDLMVGDVPLTVMSVKKLTRAIKSYDVKRLEFVDPAFNVLRAADTLREFTGERKRPPARPRARKKPGRGRMRKCR